MKIYIVRHGETEENLKKTYYGTIDCSLTSLGKLQGEKIGQNLSKVKFQKIFCSEKKRAKDTLSYICGEENIIIDKRLNERNFGDFEGKTYKELQKEYNEEYQNWTEKWIDYIPPKGESFKEFYERIRTFMEDLKDIESDGENVLIVTHGGVVRAIYCYILDGILDNYWRFSSRNADLSIISINQGYYYIDGIIPLEL